MLILDPIVRRVDAAKDESDFTYFFSLLLLGEAVFKLTVAALLASILDERERHRYRLEYGLARANGLGDWERALEDALAGPASQYLYHEAYPDQADLTRSCKQGEWQADAVLALQRVIESLDLNGEEVPVKTDLRRWFRKFCVLRNGTRAHGATLPARASSAAPDLANSINLLATNLRLFQRPWAHLHRNLSGKYRVSPISGDCRPFDYLKSSQDVALPDGVYIFVGAPQAVPLVAADPDLRDFYFGNGGFGQRKYECISYATDDKLNVSAETYMVPPGALPSSESQGGRELQQLGRCLSNAPDGTSDYVSRPNLEAELRRLLEDDRRPIITLVGRGGIGKTSLALAVISEVAKGERFEAVIWFSARDIDLLIEGPKTVQAHVTSQDDVAEYYASLVVPERVKDKDFNARIYLEGQFERNELGPTLYVFDNFETSRNPAELFAWIDTYVRLPNKILITTRLREFKGDYPVEVSGMEVLEARELVARTARALGIYEQLDSAYIDDLIERTDAHPYVIKMLLGDLAGNPKARSVPQLVANRDEVLVALFERTFTTLTPIAQRILLTLCAWNSSVPKVALEAVVLKSTEAAADVSEAIELLCRYSLLEIIRSESDGQEFVSVPHVASAFGKKKLRLSPLKRAIELDVETLQMLGPTSRSEIHLGLARRLEQFIRRIADKVERGSDLEDYRPVLDLICRRYNPGWLLLARWLLETGEAQNIRYAKSAAEAFLQESSDNAEAAEAWRIVARCCYLLKDAPGEIHAFVERSQLAAVPFEDLSSTAQRLNSLLGSDTGLEFHSSEERRALVTQLLNSLERRQQEADATDFSRMAWLALRAQDQNRAAELVKRGIALDSSNNHLSKLAQRLHIDDERDSENN